MHRDFSAGVSPRPEGVDYESHPLLLVLCTHQESPFAELQAGQTVQTVWLTATTDGLAASMISEVIEVPDTRDDLRHLLGGTLHSQGNAADRLRRPHRSSPTPSHRRSDPRVGHNHLNLPTHAHRG